MTQFVIVAANARDLVRSALSPGLLAVDLDPDLYPVVSALFPGYSGPYSKIVEVSSGEAMAIFDSLYNRDARGSLGENFIQWIEFLASEEKRISIFYGTDTDELPRFSEVGAFVSAIRGDASVQPPEVSAVFDPYG